MGIAKKGQLMALVAPASSCSELDLLNAINYATELGFEVVWSKQMLKPEKYLAQSDDFRAKDLKTYLFDENVDAIWCVRGGYGSIRLLEAMKKWKRPAKKKLFFGLSDISILHQFFIQNWNWPVYHAPILSRLGSSRASAKEKKQIKKLLFSSNIDSLEFSKLKPLNLAASSHQLSYSKLIGGNLCSLFSLQGTEFAMKAAGKIIFFEDIAERAYALDRMLYSLKISGVFKRAKGIVFGDFNEGLEPNGTDLTWYALKKFASEVSIPVWRGVPSGHGSVQMCVPLNTKVEIKGNKSATLKINLK